MISSEPVIKVGVLERYAEVSGVLREKFKIADDVIVSGEFHAVIMNSEIVLYGGKEIELIRGEEIILSPVGNGHFTLHDVIFGINFHFRIRGCQPIIGQ